MTADAIDRTSLTLAEHLGLRPGAYTADPALVTVVLDALADRGCEVRIFHRPGHHGRLWFCGVVGPAGYRHARHTELQRAVVFAAIGALGLDRW